MTGPVIKLDTLESPPESPLASSRWRTLPPDTKRPAGWARTERERCTNACGNDRRCMLREAHEGPHAWRSLGGLRVFEWA
jgi:hypothetical protein